MLDGLDAVDWGRWETAYGPATAVPDWLRLLASDDEPGAQRALERLRASVNHEDLASLAAVPTTPFLVEIARERPRWRLVLLIADLGCGGRHGLVALSPLEEALEPPLRPVREAVVGAWDLFDRLLDDKVAEVRSAAAVGLGTAFEQVGPSRDRLASRLSRERSAPVLVTLLCALGRLAAEDHHAPTAALVEPFAAHKNAGVGLAARIAAAQADPSPVRFRALLDARDAEVPKGAAWCGGDLRSLAVQLALDGMARAGDLGGLERCLDQLGVRVATSHLLRAALGPERDRELPPLRPDQIPAAARPVLELIAARFPPPTPHGTSFLAPEAWGLLSLPRLLGKVPPRPLDTVWWVAHDVRNGRRPLEEWRSYVAGCSPEDRLDLLGDLRDVPCPYGLYAPHPSPRRPPGWDAAPAQDAGFHALVRTVADAIPEEVIERLLRGATDRWWTWVVPLDSLCARRVPPQDLDEAIAQIVDTNGIDPDAARRIVDRLGSTRAERLVLALRPDLLVTRFADGEDHPAARGALLVADRAPTPAVLDHVAGWLAREAWVAHDLPEAKDAELAAFLAGILTSFPDAGARTLAAAQEAEDLGRPRWAGILRATAERL